MDKSEMYYKAKKERMVFSILIGFLLVTTMYNTWELSKLKELSHLMNRTIMDLVMYDIEGKR